MASTLTQNTEQNLPNTAILREADAGTFLATAAPTRRSRMQAFIVTEKHLSVSCVRGGNLTLCEDAYLAYIFGGNWRHL
jgi:hypothetical protein